jgi:hypothetical protein
VRVDILDLRHPVERSFYEAHDGSSTCTCVSFDDGESCSPAEQAAQPTSSCDDDPNLSSVPTVPFTSFAGGGQCTSAEFDTTFASSVDDGDCYGAYCNA